MFALLFTHSLAFDDINFEYFPTVKLSALIVALTALRNVQFAENSPFKKLTCAALAVLAIQLSRFYRRWLVLLAAASHLSGTCFFSHRFH